MVAEKELLMAAWRASQTVVLTVDRMGCRWVVLKAVIAVDPRAE